MLAVLLEILKKRPLSTLQQQPESEFSCTDVPQGCAGAGKPRGWYPAPAGGTQPAVTSAPAAATARSFPGETCLHPYTYTHIHTSIQGVRPSLGAAAKEKPEEEPIPRTAGKGRTPTCSSEGRREREAEQFPSRPLSPSESSRGWQRAMGAGGRERPPPPPAPPPAGRRR